MAVKTLRYLYCIEHLQNAFTSVFVHSARICSIKLINSMVFIHFVNTLKDILGSIWIISYLEVLLSKSMDVLMTSTAKVVDNVEENIFCSILELGSWR